MKKLLLIFLLPLYCFGQGDQTIIKVPLDQAGTTEGAILHLPDDYSTSTTKYPVMVFLHGVGEAGTNPATIYTSSGSGGPAYFIAQGLFPKSFVNPADGKSYKFIVVSPQCPVAGTSTPSNQVDYILTYLFKTYRIDTSRVYLTGLSAGGGSLLQYVGKLDGNGNKLTTTHQTAAFIPMSAVMNAYYRPLYADTIVADSIHIWGFGSPTDTHGANTLSLVTWDINTMLKANWGISTSYVGGHCCWGQFYDPTFTQNGMSIYQWALQYTKPATGAAPAVVTVPTANAGSSQTITLPTSQVTLSGTASTVTNGTIAAYSWSQQSGPSTATITTATAATTTVTGLVGGTYVFALKITDNSGNISTATVQVIVNAALVSSPPTVGLAVPGIIQAESYSTMSGIATQNTSDSGGGLNVGWIDKGDWMNYAVNVATAGVYTVSFRVAVPAAGASFQLKSGSGAVLSTITPAATGGYQIWQTVSTAVTLAAGVQTLQVYAVTGGWNFNWVQFVIGQPQAIPGKIEAESYYAMSGIATQTTTDVGGGLNVGWIDQGDWMDYFVNVAAAGTYTVNFRIAAPSSGASIQLRDSSGKVLATVSPAATGGFQTWQTVSTTATLPAGNQTLRVYSATSTNWNFNWVQFTSGVTTSQATSLLTASRESLVNDSTADTVPASFTLYPNPVRSEFTIRLDNNYQGNVSVQIADATGAIRQVYNSSKGLSPLQLNLSAANLPPGIYFVRVQIGNWVGTKKIIKL